MLKKTITYTDFNGIQQVEDHYFNLSKAEIVKMDLVERVREGEDSTTGGFAERLQRIGKSGTGKEIIETFEEFLASAYGRKSEDGRRFMKDPSFYQEFKESGAYEVMFMELMTEPEATAAFVNAVMPNMNEDSPKVSQQSVAAPQTVQAHQPQMPINNVVQPQPAVYPQAPDQQPPVQGYFDGPQQNTQGFTQ